MLVEKILSRVGGSQARIVIRNMSTPFCRSYCVDVFARQSASDNWSFIPWQPGHVKKNCADMSVDEYIQHGREPTLKAVSIPEILKIVQEAHDNWGWSAES